MFAARVLFLAAVVFNMVDLDGWHHGQQVGVARPSSFQFLAQGR